MSTNLPTTLLRSFVAIVEAGSMTGASQQVFLSQSALSFQMKKLEDLVKQPLFHRDRRRLSLTLAGDVLLDYSRKMLSLHDEALSTMDSATLSGPVRIGLVQDFSEGFLRDLLSTFAGENPGMQLYVKVSRTVQLKQLINDGQLDVAVGMSAPGDDAAVGTMAARWFGKPGLAQEDVIPLALLESPCRFRDAALDRLEQTGRRFRIIMEAPNLSALRAAVEAGIGLTCRTTLFGDEIEYPDRYGLPTLPEVGFAVYRSFNATPAARTLSTLVQESLKML